MKSTGLKVVLLVLASLFAAIAASMLYGRLVPRRYGYCGNDVEATVHVPEQVPVASGDDLRLRVFGAESKKNMLFTREGIPYSPYSEKGEPPAPSGGRTVEMSSERREYLIQDYGSSSWYLWVLAYVDDNFNGRLDKGERYGVYIGNPIKTDCRRKERRIRVEVVLNKVRKLDD